MGASSGRIGKSMLTQGTFPLASSGCLKCDSTAQSLHASSSALIEFLVDFGIKPKEFPHKYVTGLSSDDSPMDLNVGMLNSSLRDSGYSPSNSKAFSIITNLSLFPQNI
ncbi:EC1118_1L7_0793p [Saccharomyces cerevisiae EC1118]|uniref:EC1118_1L7_0793p n=1 Tax=Saccharomyces cerevisiae (strain Lalvin EC1118 / Prise de mousse) TaxID=643680 RepID=C8ZDJ6_YEAS8|nr:EC1118_1L7_0793p [Saccharomyces cerevisiae EC1118]